MFHFHFSSEEKTARLLRITASIVVNLFSDNVICSNLEPFDYADIKLLIFPDISNEMDLNDVVPTPAPCVQETGDCVKKSKSSNLRNLTGKGRGDMVFVNCEIAFLGE